MVVAFSCSLEIAPPLYRDDFLRAGPQAGQTVRPHWASASQGPSSGRSYVVLDVISSFQASENVIGPCAAHLISTPTGEHQDRLIRFISILSIGPNFQDCAAATASFRGLRQPLMDANEAHRSPNFSLSILNGSILLQLNIHSGLEINW